MGELSKRQRMKQIVELYREVPKMECKGLCANSCGPIAMSKLEAEEIEKRVGKQPATEGNPSLDCNMLLNGRCKVYGARPMICRLWGATPEMPCVHGCKTVGPPLKPERARELLSLATRIGGGAVSNG